MKNLLKSRRASTAIEFSIVAPVLFVLLLGIMEFGLTMFYDSSLNLGIRTVARQGVAQGYPVDTGQAQIDNIMAANLGGLYNADPAHTTFIIRTYNNFSDMTTDVATFKADPSSLFNTPTTLPPKACAGGGVTPAINSCQNGQIILYGVKYKWGGLTGIMSKFIPPYLYSFSIVRNETFD